MKHSAHAPGTAETGPRRPGNAGSWDWDIPARLLRFDPQLAALYGLGPEEAAAGLRPQAFFSAIYSEDVARVRIAVAGVLQGVELFSKTFRIVASDGAIRWVEAQGRAELGDDDQPVRFSGVVIDITGRRQIEERLRIAQTAGQVGTFEHVPGYATATVSDQFCSLLGLQRAEVLPVRTINRLAARGQEPLFNGKRGHEGQTFYSEVRIARADDGRERWIAQRGETVRDNEDGSVRHVGVIYDITEPRQAREDLQKLNDTLEDRVAEEVASRLEVEEALRQAQKMEAVGQLTGGIAHDFNNLLTVIMGNLDMAVRRLGATGDDRIDRALAHAMKGASRAATLTQRLLAFSRRQSLDPKRIDISRLLHGMADLLGRTLGETVSLATEIEPALWHVEIDPNQLENAVLNLAVNGRDAMDGNGTLSIVARNETIAVESLSGPPVGDYVLLSVVDTGSGMSEETISRAFDPFYTTKEVGKGTGLGLSMVYGFVTQSGGHVDILSTAGSGTTVRLFLPRLVGAPPLQAEEKVFEAEQGSSEILLVVEDDEDVRAYAVEGLRDLGYQVYEASDGPSALEVLRQEGHRIQLLLSDVIMPGMSGRDLVDAARRLFPQLRVLYTSGYPRDVIVKDGRLEHGVELLAKPFTYTDLAARVREILDR